MELFFWNDQFDVGIKKINQQHKGLVDLVNQLHAAMKAGNSKEVLEKILKEVASYEIYHFDTEEKYFKQYGYPDAKSHIEEHENCKVKVTELIKAYDEEH